ncbi:BTB/POZ domain-containing protein 2-like [Ostrinia nubilalis]|uniref:BTB/POZ domain-containing protein 2-like n=1 Tax=Ostrinia nubilalis TaxID=29057 RepID=UPI00308233F2
MSAVKHLFETKEMSDCSFMVGKTNAQLVLGHKNIISAASSVLREKLKAADTDNPKVSLTDVEPEIFQLMLKYIYTDRVEVDSETAYDLAEAAKVYEIPELIKKCTGYISDNLTTKNVLRAYSLALQSSDKEDLKKKCEELIKAKAKDVLADSTFEETCLDVVVAVFSLESLDIESELDLLNAADRYAKHITKCNNVDSETLDIRKVLQKIRFLSLTPTEFAKGRAATTVLSDSDACAILANIAYDKSSTKMPAGFSLRKDPRKTKMNINIYERSSEIQFKFPVLDIQNVIEKVEKKWSDKFTVSSLKWKVYIDFKVKDSKKFLSIYSYTNWDSDSKTWSCKAEVEFKLLRTDEDKPFSRVFNHEYTHDTNDWGYPEFIETSQLLDPKNHYIKDGAVTFQVRIKAYEPQGL